MRKIDEKTSEYFLNDKNFSLGNTKVKDKAVYLHGNKIIEKINSDMVFDTCGHRTPTTKSRMNSVLKQFGFSIYQKNHDWFLKFPNGETFEIVADSFTVPMDLSCFRFA